MNLNLNIVSGYRANEDLSLNKLFALGRHEAFNEVVRRRILAGNYFLLRRYMKQIHIRIRDWEIAVCNLEITKDIFLNH